jgi:nitronate monooxygenase
MHHFWRVIQLERVEKLGADGVQIASRFVVTEECDASDAYKQAYIKATEMM